MSIPRCGMIALWMQVWSGCCEPAWLERHFYSRDSRRSALRTWHSLLVPHVPSIGIVAGCAYVAVDGKWSDPRIKSWHCPPGVLQTSCLGICVASTLVGSARPAAMLLVLGVILSRFGLWTYDLSASQLLQVLASTRYRGLTSQRHCMLSLYYAQCRINERENGKCTT
jgi:hypothetical protein